jgi:cystathionine beta-lyase
MAVVTPLEATYLAWVNVRPYCERLGLNCHELSLRLRDEAGVALSCGTLYGAAGEGFLRVNMACPKPLLEEGLRRMTRWMA